MANGINKVILIGNVGGDPELRYMPSGAASTKLTLATSASWKDKQTGKQQERTEWHNVVFFNRLAEIVGEYVRKGSKLYIEGTLRTNQWEKDGVKRYTTAIVASEMQMLGGRENKQQGSKQGQQAGFQHNQGYQQNQSFQQPQQQPLQQQQPKFDDNFDDDIPF